MTTSVTACPRGGGRTAADGRVGEVFPRPSCAAESPNQQQQNESSRHGQDHQHRVARRSPRASREQQRAGDRAGAPHQIEGRERRPSPGRLRVGNAEIRGRNRQAESQTGDGNRRQRERPARERERQQAGGDQQVTEQPG